MKTILFPTDFSENAVHASLYAGMIARAMDAQLILLNVYSIPMATEYQIPYDVDDFLKISQEIAEENLQVFSKELIKSTGLASEKVTRITDYGQITDSIIKIAHESRADLIIIGTMGISNILDQWLGTNTQNVIKTAECPVLVIPKQAKLNFPKVIMYAADFKEDDILSTHKVLKFAHPLGAKCQVIHIHDYYEAITNQYVKEKVIQLNHEFEDDEEVSIKNINREEVYNGLKTYVRTHKPDVLALAIYEKSFLKNFFERSIIDHYMQNEDIPLLIFRK